MEDVAWVRRPLRSSRDRPPVDALWASTPLRIYGSPWSERYPLNWFPPYPHARFLFHPSARRNFPPTACLSSLLRNLLYL